MSAMEIYEVRPDGEVVPRTEFRNSFRGAVLVWMELGKKYLGLGGGFGDWEKTWKLQHSPRITDAEFCVLMSTFDASSVNQNPWWVWGGDADDGRPYNINTGDKHWFLDPSDRAARIAEHAAIGA